MVSDTTALHLPSELSQLGFRRRPGWIGFHSDLNGTYPVGKIDPESEKLIRVTRECLDAAIKICKPGALWRDIGKVMYVGSFFPALHLNSSLSLTENLVSQLPKVLGALWYGPSRPMVSISFSILLRIYLIMLRTRLLGP